MPNGHEFEIVLQNVSKRFGSVRALRDVDLQIRPGEFFTVLGPSGSGKTTMLNILAGFEEPTSGRVFFHGRDVTMVPAHKRTCRTVFQGQALFPHMSVGRNVEYGLKVARIPATERRKTAERILDFVGLGGFYDRNVNQISGGQKQRVAIARSLIMEPEILLLDEPLTGLDEKLRQHLQVELKRLHRQLRRTFVLVTHNQEEALTLSDHIAVLRDGLVEQVGTAQELYEEPINAFVAGFMGVENLLVGEVDDSGIILAGRKTPCRVPKTLAERPQGRAYLALRPERVALGAYISDQDVRFDARVLNISYKGHELGYELVLPDDQRLMASAPISTAPAGLEIGMSVAVAWHARHAIVLPHGKMERSEM